MQQDQAETIALTALSWLVANDELLPVFLGATGAAADHLRARAGDPDFLGATLDFLLLDDAWVQDFAAEAGLPPESVARARGALPGGQTPHWT